MQAGIRETNSKVPNFIRDKGSVAKAKPGLFYMFDNRINFKILKPFRRNEMILDVKSLDGVQSKTCLGCVNHKADVMVTIRTQEDKNFIDIFFSREKAEILRDRLDAVLKLNEEEDWVSNTLDPNNNKYLASMKTAQGKTYSQTVSNQL